MFDGLQDARLFDLSQPLDSSVPVHPSIIPFAMECVSRHGDFITPGGESFAVERVSMSTHTGTHIDALGHVSCNGLLYGGDSAEEAQRDGPLDRLGVEFIAPLLYRGVLLDIPAVRGVDRLGASEAVTAEDLENARRAQGVEVNPGAAVLVRTGYGDRDFYFTAEYHTMPPGVDVSGAHWLVDRNVALTGSDTFIYEQSTPVWPAPVPVHRILIAQAGVYIVENMYLEELAEAGAYEFQLIIAPLLMTGASGSPIRPLALVQST